MMDVNGNKEERRGIISVFNGPKPSIIVCDSQDEENNTVAKWLSDRINEGTQPHEIGVFVRSDVQLPRANAAVKKLQET